MSHNDSTDSFCYTGRDNLEAMREAINYNAFLLHLVNSHGPADGTWLDFGAGEGQFSIPLKRQGRSVIAVEADDHLANVNRAAGLTTYQRLADVPDGSIDYVYSLNVLEHIEADEEALRILRRKLKTGGKIFAYVPAFQMLYSSMDRLVGHHRRYTRQSLTSKFASSGFQPAECRYADSLGFLASGIFKLIPHTDGTVSARSVSMYDRVVFPMSRRLDVLAGNLFGKNVYIVASA